jgi:hypothetical protein
VLHFELGDYVFRLGHWMFFILLRTEKYVPLKRHNVSEIYRSQDYAVPSSRSDRRRQQSSKHAQVLFCLFSCLFGLILNCEHERSSKPQKTSVTDTAVKSSQKTKFFEI